MSQESESDLSNKSYRELQEIAKENDLKANQSKEELIEAIKHNRQNEGDSDTAFKDIKKDIESELSENTEDRSKIERLKTGVEGLDEISNGGIPKNHLVLLSGGPGTGKTTLALQFLLEGIRNGETAVFVNMDERKDKIIQNAKNFGWDLEKHIENDNLHFVRPSIFEFKKTKKEIDQIANHFDASRIVIDSLSVIGSAIDSEAKMRRGIMELNQRFNRLNATTLSISEINSESADKNYSVEEYSVDGIIQLYLSRNGSTFERGLAVKKMRGSNHSRTIHPVEIGQTGVKTYPDEKIFSEME